jgi:hypothetical protein
MKSRNLIQQTIFYTVFVLFFVVGATQFVMAQTPQPNRDKLITLKNALRAANAPALTAQQEQQMNAAIDTFRATNVQQGPSAELQANRNIFENAIVAGDTITSQRVADQIISVLASELSASIQARINFEIFMVNMLNGSFTENNSQMALLIQKFGTQRVIFMIQGLAGNSGKFGQGFDSILDQANKFGNVGNQ